MPGADISELMPPPNEAQPAQWSRFIALAVIIERSARDGKMPDKKDQE